MTAIRHAPLIETPAMTALQRALLASGTEILHPDDVARFKERQRRRAIAAEPRLLLPGFFCAAIVGFGGATVTHALFASDYWAVKLLACIIVLLSLGVARVVAGLMADTFRQMTWRAWSLGTYCSFGKPMPAAAHAKLSAIEPYYPQVFARAMVDWFDTDPVLYLIDEDGARYDIAQW